MAKRTPGQGKKQAVAKSEAAQTRDTIRVAVAIAAVAVLVYANALGNGLVYDDHLLIEQSWLVRQMAFLKVFTTSYWAGCPGNQMGQYRPLTVLSFLLNSLGGVTPFKFHLTNVLLHAFNSVLAFFLCRRIGLGLVAAGVCGMLFAVHPIHAEVAVGVTFGRADLLGGMFLLIGLLLYIEFRLRGDGRFYAGSLIAFFCGMLSKESAVVLVGLVAVYDLTFQPGVEGRARWRGALTAARRSWLRWGGFVAVFGLCLVVRQVAAGLGFSPKSMTVLNNPLLGAPLDVRLMTAAKLFWKYLLLLAVPIRLSVDYSYRTIPIVTSPGNLEAIGGLVLGLAGFALWVRAFETSPRAFFCGALFLVPYSAVSQTLVLVNAMFQERFLYIPALGAFALAGIGVERLWRRRQPLGIVLAGTAILLYAGRTVVRNRDWKDDYTLFSSAVRTYPESAKTRQALGDVLAARGEVDAAIVEYRKALSIRKEAMTYNNLGNAYGEKEEFAKAIDAYRNAVRMQPDYAEAWANLGVTAMRSGAPDAAAGAFEKAVKLRPGDAEWWYDLGVAREKVGRLDGAVEAYRQAVARRQDWAEAHFNLGKAYRDMGKPEAAVQEYRIFLKLWRGNPQLAKMVREQIEEMQ